MGCWWAIVSAAMTKSLFISDSLSKCPFNWPCSKLLTLIQLTQLFNTYENSENFHYLLNNDLFVPGLSRFIYITKLNCTCARSAVYIIRSYNRVHQLHESRWCMDLLSHMCLNRRRIYCHPISVTGINFISIFDAFILMCLNRHVFSQM